MAALKLNVETEIHESRENVGWMGVATKGFATQDPVGGRGDKGQDAPNLHSGVRFALAGLGSNSGLSSRAAGVGANT